MEQKDEILVPHTGDQWVATKLWFCLLMDAVGCLSYIVPGVGEWLDVLWAPLSAWIFYRAFGGRMGTIGSVIALIEEALPFVDILPTFTIAWLVRHLEKRRYHTMRMDKKNRNLSPRDDKLRFSV